MKNFQASRIFRLAHEFFKKQEAKLKNNYEKNRKVYLSKRKGFTLIELLIVIAIIGILAGVILVSTNTARDRARMANFKSGATSLNSALIVECDKSTVDLTGLDFPDLTVGAIGDALDCLNGEITAGTAVADATLGVCIATLGQTGVVFVGGDY